MNKQILDSLDAFFKQKKHQTFKKGELLIRADDTPPGVFYLTKGVVKEYAISKKGEELVINLFKPVSFFPMSWAINETPNMYFYEAVDECEVWRSSREEVISFIKSNPDVLYDLMSRVYKGVDGVLNRMTFLMSGNAYARLITELLIYAHRFNKGENRVQVTISEKDLAALSGMTRETVSREMKMLKDKGLITHDKQTLIITNVAKLEEEIAGGV